MPTVTSGPQEFWGPKTFKSPAVFEAGINGVLFLDSVGIDRKVGLFTDTPSGKFDVAPDSDNYFQFGRAWVGYNGADSDVAGFGHVDSRSATGYAIAVGSGGALSLNSGSGTALVFRVAGTSYGQLSANRWDFNIGGLDHDFRIRGDNQTNLFYADAGNDRIGIATNGPAGKLHVDQTSTTGGIPVLYLDQADVDQPFVTFATTVGSGNAIEADATEDDSKYGAVLVNVNGVGNKYIRLYDGPS